MGQKVQPHGIRLGISKDWNARWFARNSDYAANLTSDMRIRGHLRGKKSLANAAVSRIAIERPAQDVVHIKIFTARPGIVIGKKGEDIEKLHREIAAMTNCRVEVRVEEVRKPELDARLVADSICQQLEKRVMFRRALKRAVQNSMRLGAKGVKVMIAGRLNGAEIARTEWYREGRVPLHTLRADIDYGIAEANTTYGVVGVKVWIFKGEVFQEEQKPLVGAADDTGYYSENPAAPVLADEPQMVESENPAHGLDLDN